MILVSIFLGSRVILSSDLSGRLPLLCQCVADGGSLSACRGAEWILPLSLPPPSLSTATLLGLQEHHSLTGFLTGHGKTPGSPSQLLRPTGRLSEGITTTVPAARYPNSFPAVEAVSYSSNLFGSLVSRARARAFKNRTSSVSIYIQRQQAFKEKKSNASHFSPSVTGLRTATRASSHPMATVANGVDTPNPTSPKRSLWQRIYLDRESVV